MGVGVNVPIGPRLCPDGVTGTEGDPLLGTHSSSAQSAEISVIPWDVRCTAGCGHRCQEVIKQAFGQRPGVQANGELARNLTQLVKKPVSRFVGGLIRVV